MKTYVVKTQGFEIEVSAKDWYNAIQLAYEKYLKERKSETTMSYMEFRRYCTIVPGLK